MKTWKSTTSRRHATRREVLQSIKDTIFNVGLFDGMSSCDNSYIYVTCSDDPEHIIVIQRDPDQDYLDELKSLKVGDISSIEEYYGCTGDTSTVEVVHTFSANGVESVTTERYLEEIEEPATTTTNNENTTTMKRNIETVVYILKDGDPAYMECVLCTRRDGQDIDPELLAMLMPPGYHYHRTAHIDLGIAPDFAATVNI